MYSIVQVHVWKVLYAVYQINEGSQVKKSTNFSQMDNDLLVAVGIDLLEFVIDTRLSLCFESPAALSSHLWQTSYLLSKLYQL